MKSRRTDSEYTQEDVSAANVAVYESGAGHYDERVITADSHARLERILSLAVTMVRRSSAFDRDVKCLDVAGGTGNASWLLDDMGCAVTMVDISPAMIRQFNERCQRGGRSIDAECVDVVGYFEASTADDKFDLIVFSSALHHFRYPDQIIGPAMGLLEPGGIIVTVADPTRRVQARWFRLCSLADRQTHLLLKDPTALAGKVLSRLDLGRRSNGQAESDIGRVAEFHAALGIDDISLAARTEELGGTMLLHRRYTGGYTWPFQQLYRALSAGTSFCMLISNRHSPELSRLADGF